MILLQIHIYQLGKAELDDRLAPIFPGGNLLSSQVIIVQAGETSGSEAFVRELARRVPQNENALMTIAYQCEQRVFRRAEHKASSSGNNTVLN